MTGGLVAVGRWVKAGPILTGRGRCVFCGAANKGSACPERTCRLCGTVQCASITGECRVCRHGYLAADPATVEDRLCGRKQCKAGAVARAPRVRRVCATHAAVTSIQVGRNTSMTLTTYAATRIVIRDAGAGPEHWRYQERVIARGQ